MNDPQDQEPQDVSTEPQRQALDEMSRRLVENLNAMVREQNERAERFAATQHSLSHLPGMPELPPELPQTEVAPAARPQQKQHPTLPPRPTKRKEPERFEAAPLRDAILNPKRPRPAPIDEVKKKAEEGGCGSGTIITLIIILVIIIRSCS